MFPFLFLKVFFVSILIFQLLTGHVVPQMLPGKPDIHALNCWRPSG